MALLTAQRNTKQQGRDKQVIGVEASTTIYLGALVAIDDAGYAIPAQAPTGSSPITKIPKVVGRADRLFNGIPGQDANNAAGAAGAISIEVSKGLFLYDNDGSIVQANVGQYAVALDDHTMGADIVAVAVASATVPGSGALQLIEAHRPVVIGSAVVQNSGQTVTYVEDTDYYWNYDEGIIYFIGSNLVASTAIKLAYSYHKSGAYPVAGKIISVDPSGGAWVDTFDQALVR